MGSPGDARRVVIIGAGITGLAAAHRILRNTTSPDWEGGPVAVTVLEADSRVGGKIRTSPFAGAHGSMLIDEGADAYLTRVPHAVRLVRELGLDDFVNPEPVGAAVMHHGLHRIPEGLMLGVPTGVMSLARSPLMSWRGKLRAALEPVLPSSGRPPSGGHGDSIGTFVRQRFGREVHELLVDPLVGGIYASDTDNFSLEMVPQLHDLSEGRSVLLTARKKARANAATNSAAGKSSPIFEAPRNGIGSLVDATHRSVVAMGGTVVTSSPVHSIERHDSGTSTYYAVNTGDSSLRADAIIITSPGAASGGLLRSLDSEAAQTYGTTEHASVVMVTLTTVERAPAHLRGMSGYLVPKPDQQRVTAVSFGSNKWGHWRPTPDPDSMLMRVSLGRDGAPTHDLIHEWSDEQLVSRVVDEVSTHTGFRFTPAVTRVSRWEGAFPQYRPGHGARITSIERRLAISAPRVRIAGASVRGIGIPACIGQAESAAAATLAELADLRN